MGGDNAWHFWRFLAPYKWNAVQQTNWQISKFPPKTDVNLQGAGGHRPVNFFIIFFIFVTLLVKHCFLERWNFDKFTCIFFQGWWKWPISRQVGFCMPHLRAQSSNFSQYHGGNHSSSGWSHIASTRVGPVRSKQFICKAISEWTSEATACTKTFPVSILFWFDVPIWEALSKSAFRW